jgi:ribosomal protein L29
MTSKEIRELSPRAEITTKLRETREQLTFSCACARTPARLRRPHLSCVPIRKDVARLLTDRRLTKKTAKPKAA